MKSKFQQQKSFNQGVATDCIALLEEATFFGGRWQYHSSVWPI
jgi:hypothetical protein